MTTKSLGYCGADPVPSRAGRRLFLAAFIAAGAYCSATDVRAQSYVPSTISFQDLSGAPLVCVIGSSIDASPANPPAAPGAYYLTQPTGAGSGTGQWTLAGVSNVVQAIQIGGASGVSGFTTEPSGQPYINSANLSIYVIKTVPVGFSCANITYTMDNLGNFQRPLVNFPSGVVEATVWQTSVNSIPSPVLTLDTSNVDSFEIPLTITLSQGSTTLGKLGNPDGSSTFTRQTMITGPQDAGGSTSPFVTWLKTQPVGGAPTSFQNLALAAWPATPSRTTPQYPFASIISPNDYLNIRCLVSGNNQPNIPSNCTLNGDMANWYDPLNSYYEKEISSFFKNAYSAGNYALVVMGDNGTPTAPDASPSIPEQPWTVTGNTSCPAYLKPDSQSIVFTGSVSTTTKIVLCNPVGQVVNFPSTGIPASSIHKATSVPGSVQTYTIDLTQAEYAQFSQYKGWYFGQPSTGWVGQITGMKLLMRGTRPGYQMALNVIQGPSTTQTTATPCVFQTLTPCPSPNPSFTEWVFSNISWTTNNKWSETPSQMVFANDGAFASWDYYNGNTSLAKVARSIQRNIVNAFSRGIANCNNVTMNPANKKSIRTGLCSQVTSIILKPDAGQTPGGFTPSDQYWSNEGNWYPANGYQNYYSQYLHTAQLSGHNMFRPPNNLIMPTSHSNQNYVMGMAYGYGFDENPVYIPGSTPTYGNVPTKLDPIPSAWFATLPVTATITIGPYN
ncbi:hypothetical protein [Methylocapsa palsarum]|uniref:Uncharacterized protein n=1 Tax=Methylocapsa palsarum TaxID=1612308 RepID=A0A1I3WAX6_9HYPH|nr:hypothetical protein [Methylocapsa palsarum]SFK03576.1 hypothetical protein SAMN05444581_101415 [Methylocapsa palsarum]